MSDLSHLYEFHAIDTAAHSTVPKVNRYQAVSQLLAWMKKGSKVESMRVERLSNGKWIEDDKYREQLRKRYTAELSKPAPAKASKSTAAATLSSVLYDMARVTKIAAQASEFTPAHKTAIDNAFEAYSRLLTSMAAAAKAEAKREQK